VVASWAAVAVLFLLYRVRVRQLLALERVRHHIARDLHDDMGSTLSSISILSQLARNHQHENRPDQAAALLDQIGESSRRMMDSMDDIVWAINPAHDSMEAVTTRMRIFASEVLEARGIDFSFTVTPEVQGLRLQMRARREFYLLFKEAINNLAKYARCQHATIHLDHQHNRLLLTVRDDGVGFDMKAPAQGSGNGLANMRARAAALHGKLEIKTAPGQGTELRLSVPLST
jgi:signal transduction histidine kinase